MIKCQRCGLPQFEGPAGYVGPQCKCWAAYSPAPNAANQGCQPARPLTEAEVRQIVRDELRRAGLGGEQ